MNANRPMTELFPPPSFAKPDIVRRFLAWAQSADAEARAEATSALARAYLYSDLRRARARRGDARDDGAARRSFGPRSPGAGGSPVHASDAPRAVILALAGDEPDVAAAVLQRSPVLTDADLVDCAANGDVVAQTALARRPDLPPGRGRRAGRERASCDAVLALIANPEIDLPAELLAPHFHPLQRRRERARGAARARLPAGELEGAHRGGGGEGLERRGVAVDAARASRAHRPRGARSSRLFDRLLMPRRRARELTRALAHRRRAYAGLAVAFAAWRRTDSVRTRLWRNCPACR